MWDDSPITIRSHLSETPMAIPQIEFPRPFKLQGATVWRRAEIEKIVGHDLPEEPSLMRAKDVSRVSGIGQSTIWRYVAAMSAE